jgi:general secretion pathway protein D
MALRHFKRHAWAALIGACLFAGCATSGPHAQALRLIESGDREAALELLAQASREDPTNSRYRLDLLTHQAAHARDLLQRADEARRAGKLDVAAEFYTKALKVDPASDRARRGLSGVEQDARHAEALAAVEVLLRESKLDVARERINAVLADNPGHPQANALLAQVRDRAEKQQQARAAAVAAQSVMRKPVTLQFRDANLRMVFEALSRTTGLNVILDRDVRADLKTTIFVKDAAVEDTVDLILLQNQLEKRTLNANTLFIYPATTAKQKEYQDLHVRTFQIANADAKYLQGMLKSVLKLKEVSVDDRTNTLVMRDTRDAIAVAAKVIAAHDVPEPEVMLEVEVLEVSHDRLSNLGIKFPEGFQVATPNSANTLGALKNLTRNQLLVSPLQLGLNLKLEDTDANLLASPRIRARHKEKARIMIGDRVPILTNAVTPVSSGSPVITGSVQYQDVGLKLEFEPQIYSATEVGIKINLEVSNIVKEVGDPANGGSLAYQIGTRNAQTSLRLRDGETQILAGLISDQERNVSSRLPGLGHLPTVGKLFGNNSGTNTKSEIVLSITPRIVRPPVVLEATLRDIFSGTESSLRENALQLDPIGAARGQSPGAPGFSGSALPQVEGAGPGAGGTPAPPAVPAASPLPTAPGAGAPGGAVGGSTGSTGSGAPRSLESNTPVPAEKTVPDAPQPQGPVPPSIKPGAIFKPALPSAPAVPATEKPPRPSGESVQAPGAPEVFAAAAPEATAARAATAAPAQAAAPAVEAPGRAQALAAKAGSGDGAKPANAPDPELNFRGASSVKVGETLQVALDATSLPRVKGLPLTVRYDPLVLRFVGADLGDLAQQAGAAQIAPRADAATGRLDIAMSFTKPEQLSGNGTLVNLSFAANTARAQTRLVATQIDIKAEGGVLLTVPRPRPHLVKVTQ